MLLVRRRGMLGGLGIRGPRSGPATRSGAIISPVETAQAVDAESATGT